MAVLLGDGGSEERLKHLKGEKQLDPYFESETMGKFKYFLMKNLIKVLGEKRLESALRGV